MITGGVGLGLLILTTVESGMFLEAGNRSAMKWLGKYFRMESAQNEFDNEPKVYAAALGQFSLGKDRIF